MSMLLALLAGCGAPAPPPPPRGLQPLPIGQLLAEVESSRDRPRVYNFWATWCGPCMRELPALRVFGETHPNVDLVLVNVDLPSLHDTRVRATLERMKLTEFENLALDDADPAYALNQLDGWPNSIPVTLVVSSRGERVRQFNTSVDGAMLEAALKGVR